MSVVLKPYYYTVEDFQSLVRFSMSALGIGSLWNEGTVRGFVC